MMVKLWVVSRIALVTLVLALVGCGHGGGNSLHPNAGGGQNPAVGSSGPDSDGGVAWWDLDRPGVVTVRMNPQPVDLHGGWPSQRHNSSVNAQTGLPQPSQLATLLAGPKQPAYLGSDLLKPGVGFDASLPNSRVNTLAAPSAIFSPVWGAQATPGITDAAYCVYRFNLDGYMASGELQTLALAWHPGSTPADYKDLWLGFANRESDHWDWYAGPDDDVLTLDSYAPYIDSTGNMAVAIVILGVSECALDYLQVGEPEHRGTGANPQDYGEDPLPPPDPSILPDSVDLSADCSPVGDQGQVGACTAFAIGRGAFDFEMGQTYKSDGWDFKDPHEMASPKYLYVLTGIEQGFNCPDEGRYVDGAIDFLVDSGDASELNAPYIDVCSQDWGQAAVDDAALFNLEHKHWINPTGLVGVHKLKSILAIQRKTVVLSTGITSDFDGLGPGEVWNYSGGTISDHFHHAMCIVGYDDGKQAFKVRNSWGSSWADGGYGWIAYRNFEMAYTELHLGTWTMDVEYDPAAAQWFCGHQQEIIPPTDINASDGYYLDMIKITWEKSPGATGYKVYRDQQSSAVATVGDVASWIDHAVVDNYSHVYWVTTVSADKESIFNSLDVGYAAQAPVVLNVIPQTGMAGSDVEFYASAYGSGPMYCTWDFGGGATPNTAESFNVYATLGEVGVYHGTLRIENNFGEDLFEFTYIVRDPNPGPGDWWMCGRNAQHNARSPYTGPESNALKWSYNAGSVGGSPVIATDGTLYVTADGGLRAINADGTPRWFCSTGGSPAIASPAIGVDGSIYVGSIYAKLLAFKPDGSFQWAASVGSLGMASPTIDEDGTIYIGSVPSGLVAYNPDGSRKWLCGAGMILYSSAAIGEDGTIYVGSYDKKLYAINPNGTFKWSYATGDRIDSSPAVGPDGTVYVGSNDNNLYAINPNGSLRWVFATRGSVQFSPVIGADETLYVGSLDGDFYAINPDGSRKWIYPVAFDSEAYSTAAIDAAGTVYLGSADGNVYAINPDGSRKWAYETGGSIQTSPAIGADGTIYIGSTDGNLYAIGPGAG
jgi:outer membrane protein assembly factor BamB